MNKCYECEGTGNEWYGNGSWFRTCSKCNGTGILKSNK